MKKFMFLVALATLPFIAANGHTKDSMEQMRAMGLPADINFPETSDGGAMGRELITTYMAREVDPVVDSVLKLNQFCLDKTIVNKAYFTAVRSTYLDMLRRISTQQVIFMDFKGSPEELKAEMEKARSMMDDAKKAFMKIKLDLTLRIVRYKLTRIETGLEDDIAGLEAVRKQIAGI